MRPRRPAQRALTETQRQLSGRDGTGQSKLARPHSEEYSGASTTEQSVNTGRGRRTSPDNFMDTPIKERALVIASQLKGSAGESLDIFEVQHVDGPKGLQMVWQILDRA